MDRIYRYSSDASYKPNGGTYPQLITAKDLYIQGITVVNMMVIAIVFKLNSQTSLLIIQTMQ